MQKDILGGTVPIKTPANYPDANNWHSTFQFVFAKKKAPWQEVPSTPQYEPFGHVSIAVGNPFGSYTSYSFALDKVKDLSGYVYLDTKKGGPILKYKKTTPAEEALFKTKLNNMIGQTGTYGFWPGADLCRSWSFNQFEQAPGVLITPPTR